MLGTHENFMPSPLNYVTAAQIKHFACRMGGNEQTAEQTTSKTTSVKVGVYRKLILCLGKISDKKKKILLFFFHDF